MRATEEAAFSRGITAEELMDVAAAGIARTVSMFFPRPGRCIVFAGKGNNAGDAFAAAGILRSRGWEIDLRPVFPETEMGELARKKFSQTFNAQRSTFNVQRQHLDVERWTLDVGRSLIILDGLLGLGARPPLRDPIRTACREINRLRVEENAFAFAVDIPTGLDGDTGEADEDCVVADCTVTIGAAKRGVVVDQALDFVGRLEVVPLPALVGRPEAQPSEIVATAAFLSPLLPRRRFGAYKNQFGRVGVVAGSKGLTGAALMCSLGALRAGAGLVELFVPEEIYPAVAASAAPEVMVKPIAGYDELRERSVDVWAVGSGLGRAAEILSLIADAPQPVVVDADGLNLLATKMDLLGNVAGPRLLTPHAGEMKRMQPDQAGTRAGIARKFCESYPVTLLLKGSRTIVAERKNSLSYNSTGNPGMATGGMGDVLTGVCAALIAQKLSPYDAARLGAWLCGRAAEISIFDNGQSEQSLLPSDVLAHLGRAFKDLQARREYLPE